MNIYIYNNDFESLLNLFNVLAHNKIKPDNIKNEYYSPTLFDNVIKLDLDNKCNINKIIQCIGINNFNIIFLVFLSDEENKELIMYYYFLNAIKYKEKLIYMRNLKCVNSSLKISKYVKHEAHKYKGFVRFKELKKNILYAEIEPTNNILMIISKHFKSRLKNEYWIIKDNIRNIISVYDKNDYFIVDKSNFKMFDYKLSENELDIENLWREFYKTIGIESRKNDRCRMNFMPKKYWKYIIEMSD